MGKNIYVGNLPYDTTGDDLRQLFESFGAVGNGQVIIDKFSGRSRGFGFVEMDDDREADLAIEALNGTPYGGRPLTVNEARPREERGVAAAEAAMGLAEAGVITADPLMEVEPAAMEVLTVVKGEGATDEVRFPRFLRNDRDRGLDKGL